MTKDHKYALDGWYAVRPNELYASKTLVTAIIGSNQISLQPYLRLQQYYLPPASIVIETIEQTVRDLMNRISEAQNLDKTVTLTNILEQSLVELFSLELPSSENIDILKSIGCSNRCYRNIMEAVICPKDVAPEGEELQYLTLTYFLLPSKKNPEEDQLDISNMRWRISLLHKKELIPFKIARNILRRGIDRSILLKVVPTEYDREEVMGTLRGLYCQPPKAEELNNFPDRTGEYLEGITSQTIMAAYLPMLQEQMGKHNDLPPAKLTNIININDFLNLTRKRPEA